MVYKSFVYYTDLSLEEASQAMERELGRIPISDEQSVSGDKVQISGVSLLFSEPLIEARIQVGGRGTEMRGRYIYLEPLYFLLIMVPLVAWPFLAIGPDASDWGALAGSVIAAVATALRVREGLSFLRAFRLVAEEALGEQPFS